MAALPGRTDAEEDAFVARLADEDEQAPLVDAITAALEAKRPRLAARLVGLLDGEVDDPAVHEAQRAARFLLLQGLGPEDVSWSALDEAWSQARRDKLRRIKRRMRRPLEGRADPHGHDRHRRRR